MAIRFTKGGLQSYKDPFEPKQKPIQGPPRPGGIQPPKPDFAGTGEALPDTTLAAPEKSISGNEGRGQTIIDPKSGTFENVQGGKGGLEFTDPKTGEQRVFLGLNKDDIENVARQQKLAPNELEPISEQITGSEKGELAKQFEEAGVNKTPTLTPIIEDELENLGVIASIAVSIIPGLEKRLRVPQVGFGGKTGADVLGVAVPSVTRTDVLMDTETINSATKSEISKELDAEIDAEEVKIVEFGIGGALVGIGVGGTLLDAVRQAVGSDKAVKNLEASITQFDSIYPKVAMSVENGLPVTDAFAKLNRIEEIVANLERQLQQAAITSPNVRISQRGREIEGKILSSRENLQAARLDIAATASARAFGEENIPKSLAFLQGLQK